MISAGPVPTVPSIASATITQPAPMESESATSVKTTQKGNSARNVRLEAMETRLLVDVFHATATVMLTRRKDFAIKRLEG